MNPKKSGKRLVCRKLSIKYDSYKHRLSFFNLDTSKFHRITNDLIFIFKIFQNSIDLKFDFFFPISLTLKFYQLITS